MMATGLPASGDFSPGRDAQSIAFLQHARDRMVVLGRRDQQRAGIGDRLLEPFDRHRPPPIRVEVGVVERNVVERERLDRHRPRRLRACGLEQRAVV